jgi:hypothetical protein
MGFLSVSFEDTFEAEKQRAQYHELLPITMIILTEGGTEIIGEI